MYNRLLCPLDGSKLSECSLEHVKAIAAGCRVTSVVLLTVIEEPELLMVQYDSQQAIEEEVKLKEKQINEMKKGAEDYLAIAAQVLRNEGITVQIEILQSSAYHGVADAILDFAQNSKADLIIMSTHGRSGISRWAFGSVTDKVIRHSKVPVLTVTSEGCRA